MSNFINCTPHPLNICNEDGNTVLAIPAPPTGTPLPRVSVVLKNIEYIGVIPLFKAVVGEVIDLPDEEENVFLIVSSMLQAAAPQRKDLLSPGELIRDENRQPIGCKGLKTLQ